MTILGDKICLQTKHKEMVQAFSEHDYVSMIGAYRTGNLEEVKKNHTIQVDANGRVRDLEEKLWKPWNNLVGCGNCLFASRVFDYLCQTPFSPRTGKREIAEKYLSAEERK